MYSCHCSGTLASGKIAVTGHTDSHAPQSMHSSGWMNSIDFNCSLVMPVSGGTCVASPRGMTCLFTRAPVDGSGTTNAPTSAAYSSVQSTCQTSTHERSVVLMHGSAIMYVIQPRP